MEAPTLLIPIMLSIWVYLDAEERGSSCPLWWALGTLLFSIIAFPSI